MKYFCSEFKGLRIVIKPMEIYKDEFGRKKKKPGVYAHFKEGEFSTNDPDIIKYMEVYMQENPSDGVTAIDEKKLEKEKKIRAKVEKKVKEEMEKEEQVEKASKKSKSKSKEKAKSEDFD